MGISESVRLIAPDQTTVIREGKVKFRSAGPDAFNATNVTVFGQVKFEKPGAYYIEVLVDDVLKLRFPIPVRVVATAARARTRAGTGPGSGATSAD